MNNMRFRIFLICNVYLIYIYAPNTFNLILKHICWTGHVNMVVTFIFFLSSTQDVFGAFSNHVGITWIIGLCASVIEGKERHLHLLCMFFFYILN